MPFMNQTFSKEIMTRTRIRNKFLKDISEANKKKYLKQRSYCVSNLNEKSINDNKTFWKTIKPFLSDKVRSTNKMTLIDKEEIIAGDNNTTIILFFSNIVSNLNIAEYLNCEPLANNTALQIIFKISRSG